MKDNTETIMPGFTHLQKAQPITLAHHMGAYFEMFKRDHMRLKDIYKRMNSFHCSQDRSQCTVYTSCLSTNKFRNIRILLLWHDTASGAVAVIDIDKLVFIGIPDDYNKDMQEDKELVFDAIDTVKGCLALFTGMLATMKFNKERMLESCRHGFTNATDAADYLVNHGVPFRDAHGIVGKLVLYCIDKKIALDDMSLEEYKEISPVFEEDIYDAISMETCVNKRNTIGAPGPKAMKKVIALHEAYLEEC